ncbi:angiomotin-like [Anser cygnoides]|uniref:angiomotin-like n=1 Tax=Anser cygnoides TaxID=8845 RepID=UPI0034D1B781
MSQGATSKAPTAPSATGPSVPPPTAEPVDCTSSASALAGGAVGEATEAPLTAAAAPQEEVASPVTADLLREDITDLSPAAADEAGAAATPLAMVLGHQVAAEQGGQAQSSSCTKDMPADEPATSQAQAPSQAQARSQGLLAGPVQRSEQHQGLGILDLAQAPARQPRPSRLRRALRALRRAFCCSCIAGQRE